MIPGLSQFLALPQGDPEGASLPDSVPGLQQPASSFSSSHFLSCPLRTLQGWGRAV